jgi:hypothetical protein
MLGLHVRQTEASCIKVSDVLILVVNDDEDKSPILNNQIIKQCHNKQTNKHLSKITRDPQKCFNVISNKLRNEDRCAHDVGVLLYDCVEWI